MTFEYTYKCLFRLRLNSHGAVFNGARSVGGTAVSFQNSRDRSSVRFFARKRGEPKSKEGRLFTILLICDILYRPPTNRRERGRKPLREYLASENFAAPEDACRRCRHTVRFLCFECGLLVFNYNDFFYFIKMDIDMELLIKLVEILNKVCVVIRKILKMFV